MKVTAAEMKKLMYKGSPIMSQPYRYTKNGRLNPAKDTNVEL